jgi:predicted AlkP superfamily pyrophosphatase or phosphodiesterase
MTVKKILLTIFILASQLYPHQIEQPKLVVGIVIDQMRYDYLLKFKKYYGQNGFDRLINNGTDFTYAHFNYVPTFTAPGHSSIYTGTTPFFHGIIANSWFDRKENKTIASIEDKSVNGLGTKVDEGKCSPRRLLATTITDQLKLATNGTAKVISISIKDRASILPGGHSANAAYWFSDKNGNFISSTYYINKLPSWVENFNKRKLADKYISQVWNLSLPDPDYKISYPDEAANEKDVFNEGRTSFPHSLANIKNDSKYPALLSTPYGNQLVLEFAEAAIKNENLGKNSVPDFLAISFSSTDYVGHAYGPNSVEVEDIYVKLDKQIAELLSVLDKEVGKGNYLLFLTADHGVMESVGHLKKLNINGNNFDEKSFLDSLKYYTEKKYNNNKIILNFSNKQIFLDHQIIKNKKLDIANVEKDLADYIMTFPGIAIVRTRTELEKEIAERESNNLILNGFNFKRSGDLAFEFKPNVLPGYGKGSSHGSRYNYDTHVPMIFYGWKIPKQEINDPVYTIDIAPTIANLIGIQEPNECIGIPVIKSK